MKPIFNDIALVQLKKELTLNNEDLGRMCLPVINVPLVNNQQVTFQTTDI